MGPMRSSKQSQAGFISWTHLFIAIIIAGGVWHFMKPQTAERTAWPSAGVPVERMAQIAATVRQGDVVMYSTTTCRYCNEAKSWLGQYGFAFKDCNMSNDQSCVREFESFGADGTPYLVVRGHHMRNGFDSDEFLAALEK